MINPLQPVYVFFRYFLTAIPKPILLLVYLVFGLYCIAAILRLIFR